MCGGGLQIIVLLPFYLRIRVKNKCNTKSSLLTLAWTKR